MIIYIPADIIKTIYVHRKRCSQKLLDMIVQKFDAAAKNMLNLVNPTKRYAKCNILLVIIFATSDMQQSYYFIKCSSF